MLETAQIGALPLSPWAGSRAGMGSVTLLQETWHSVYHLEVQSCGRAGFSVPVKACRKLVMGICMLSLGMPVDQVRAVRQVPACFHLSLCPHYETEHYAFAGDTDLHTLHAPLNEELHKQLHVLFLLAALAALGNSTIC